MVSIKLDTEMKSKTLIFLKPFTLKNPTLDQQNEFMMRENVNVVECADLGKIYNNDDLDGHDLTEFITQKVKGHRPEWVVAEGECATVALKMKRQKKILLNPKVNVEDLNNVAEHTRQNTYGFFDDRHEQDYERFQSVYPHVAWFPQDENLTLFTIKEIVQEIIETEEW